MKFSPQMTLFFISSLVIFNLWIVVTAAQPWVISLLNIFFHEAGHWVFGIFGEFIGVLGGTLGELLIPSVFVIYFYLQNNIPGQVFSWWWLSTALYSTSIYISDARAQILPLVGGPGGHDWFYLLGRLRLLDFDILIGRILVILVVFITGWIIVLGYRYWELYKEKNIS